MKNQYERMFDKSQKACLILAEENAQLKLQLIEASTQIQRLQNSVHKLLVSDDALHDLRNQFAKLSAENEKLHSYKVLSEIHLKAYQDSNREKEALHLLLEKRKHK